MHAIELHPFGVRLEFSGFIDAGEMRRWAKESRRLLASMEGPFAVFVDMRGLRALPADAQAIMIEGQKHYRERGMQRSVVVLDNAITAAQFRRLASRSGIRPLERYLSASDVPDWQEVGMDWILDGIEPESRAA